MLSIDVPKVQQQHRSRVKGEGRFTQELPQDGPEENCRVISALPRQDLTLTD
jgi:hypothetical protein